ncbi:MAG: sulfurtransferase [Rhodovulum sulfidophilum]|uniref:Sulfurtransferase n=1 Tax=Rhodovulum sulfidophilum TaxID=35806 RepID=A0A2W5NDI2_RHOSU|nr:MAG: sulfurtransferase [Rhodovulum sulfidophilum]
MTVNTVTVAEAARWIAAGEAILVDVRAPDEFRAEHIAAAVSLPLATLPGALANLPAGRRLVFQCLRGGRGASACALAAGSAPESYNLEGGIEAWKAAGLPVVGAAPAGPPLFRQVQIAVGLIVLALILAGFLVAPVFFALAGVVGAMLALAGVTGWCGMALLLRRMPWNRAGAA